MTEPKMVGGIPRCSHGAPIWTCIDEGDWDEVVVTPPAPLDPDPRYVPEDPRVPESWEHRRSKVVQRGYANDLAETTSCLLLVLGLLAVLAIVVAVLVASRSGPDPTTPPPASDAAGSVRALALVSASTSDPSQSEAPPAAALAVSGPATWYDAPTIHDAAAGPALRKALGPHWRGSTVRVCASSCVTVQLTDWCACGHHRVIDLDDRAFARLAPLSQGIVRVRITVVGQIDEPATATAPPTDVGP